MEDGLADFADRVGALARRLLPEAATTDRLTAFMRRLAAEAEGEARRPGNELPVACTAGCGDCCRLNATVLWPEAVAIARFCRERLSPPERLEAAARLEDLYWHLAWLEDEEPVLLPAPCAFLDAAGCCAIYPVRPLLCRSITSTDPESCRQAIASQATGETRPIVMNQRRKAVLETAFIAIGRALEEMGLDARGVPLSVALRVLLQDPGAGDRFLAGLPVTGT